MHLDLGDMLARQLRRVHYANRGSGAAEIRTRVQAPAACGVVYLSKPILPPAEETRPRKSPPHCTAQLPNLWEPQTGCTSPPLQSNALRIAVAAVSQTVLALPIKDSNLDCLVQSQVSYR